MESITVEKLAEFCEAQKRLGNGKKKVLLSDDDEGNGYHELFFGFSPTEQIFGGEYSPSYPYGINLNDYITLA